MKAPVKAVLVVSALTLLSGCVAVPADTAYYEPASVYYAPPVYYYGPAIQFSIHGGYYRHFGGGHHRHRHGGRRGHRQR